MLAVAMAAAVLFVSPEANAAPEAVARPTAAPCPSGWNCVWSKPHFTGGEGMWQDPWWDDCANFATGYKVRSYAFYGGEEGYFYSGGNCTGNRKLAPRNSESIDIGFDAYSFRAACASC